MSRGKKVSFALFGTLVLGVVFLKLGGVLLAGLFSYMVLDLANRRFLKRMKKIYAQWLSFLVFLIVATAVVWIFSYFIRQLLSTLPKIANTAIPVVIDLAERYGFSLPFDDIYQFREVLIKTVKENAPEITKASGLLSKKVFHIIAGMFVAVLCFFTEHDTRFGPNLFDAVRHEFDQRIKEFMEGFERVLGAQVIISSINTAATAIFLLATGFPYVHFLVPMTFIVGILPILGNVISNTFIVATAITISPKLAAAALIFLIVIHKAEYFLNSRIVGSSIQLPMWQTLVGILVGETVMGVPGIILAPAMLYYMKEEMRAIPVAVKD
ncbi:MAG: AI-2E family transporter [Elusimicrobia bacterium]|nr:AI-2E family transporter [Elusimicrobiota bacterium]